MLKGCFFFIVLLFLFPLCIGLIAGGFGIVIGIFGAIIGAIAGIFGALFGLIGGIFDAIFGIFGWAWHGSPAYFAHSHYNGFVIAALIIVAALIVSKQNRKKN